MDNPTFTSTARREFLKFLAASPYVAALGGVTAFLERSGFAQSTPAVADVIAIPAEALDVMDFEEAAHRKVHAWALGLHGQRRRRRRHAARQSRRLQARGAASAPPARRHQSGHARRAVRHHVQQPDFPVPHRRRKIVLSRGRIGRRARGQGARHAADPFDSDLDCRRRREQGARPPGLAAALRAQLLGCLRKNSAARGSRRLPGDRADRRQHHRPQQRNLSAHAPQGSAPVHGLPRRRARHRPSKSARCTTAST